jgi:hypothetical protein
MRGYDKLAEWRPSAHPSDVDAACHIENVTVLKCDGFCDAHYCTTISILYAAA